MLNLRPSHRPGCPSPEDASTGTASPQATAPGSHRQEDPAWPPALQRLGKIAEERRSRSDVDTLFEPKRPIT
ncbi:hypothetical protein [Phaeodactylibacter xiamenensis]|uniref:hypothetical protein n=1 Tax=Phaeodactylibacter xiamenensis TaxID=1524460 RepID=UPI003CCB7A08